MKPLFKILLLVFTFFVNGLMVKANVSIDFGSDTLYLCYGEPAVLAPSISGGSTPYQFLWSTGETTSFIDIIPVDSSKMYYLTIIDGSGSPVVDSVLVMAMPECVWPGDANGDGVANNRDVLILGLTYGEQGLERPDAHTNWIGQGAPAWNQVFGTGLNYVHADTDGDGEVGKDDFAAIKTNYLQPVPAGSDTVTGTQGVPLYIDFPNQNYQVGDTLVVSVYLGTSQIPTDSIYGIAFSINYDKDIIDSGSVSVDYSNSWLGTQGSNLEAVDQDFHLSGQVDIGITRIDHTTAAGYGRIADITVMIDDITGKKETEEITIELANVSLIDMAGKALPVNSSSAKVNITLSNEEIFSSPSTKMNIYPNPTEGFTSFEVDESYSKNSTLIIRDIQGRVLRTKESQYNQRINLDLSSLSSGIYIAEWLNNKNKLIKKFTIK